VTLAVFILAAGASRRLGQPKQLLEMDGQPLIRRQCRMALESGVGPVFAVLGSGAEACRAAIAGLPVTPLENLQWSEGLAVSLRLAATRAIADSAEAMVVLHVDQYAVRPEDLARLVDCWRGDPSRAHLSRDGSHLGPPAVIPAGRYALILSLTGDAGARRGLPDAVEVPLPGAGLDIDEPQHRPQ
jgi:CTP:molybdopterin cytidylyltransferase MocA